MTVEPGVYLPDRGGVRIEDTLVVGERGPELLTRFPKELAILTSWENDPPWHQLPISRTASC